MGGLRVLEQESDRREQMKLCPPFLSARRVVGVQGMEYR